MQMAMAPSVSSAAAPVRVLHRGEDVRVYDAGAEDIVRQLEARNCEPEESWCSGGVRGVLNTALRLGRRRPATDFDRLQGRNVPGLTRWEGPRNYASARWNARREDPEKQDGKAAEEARAHDQERSEMGPGARRGVTDRSRPAERGL